VPVVVGAAVPTAVCDGGLCPRCPGVGRCLSGVDISSLSRAPASWQGIAIPQGRGGVEKVRYRLGWVKKIYKK